MNLLAIDTSNNVLGVAILKNKQIVGEYVTNLKKNHSLRLMPAIHQLMHDVLMSPADLDKIVVAKGPGSYTGVRIGLTTAKSLAWALDIPVVGVSSLEVLAYQGRFFPSYICPFFDARRRMVYIGLYEWKDHTIQIVQEEKNILMEDWLKQIADKGKDVLFISPDLKLYEEMIYEYLGERAIFPEDPFNISKPSHLGLASINKDKDHLHTLIPNYLRLAEAEANWLKTRTKDIGQ